MLVAKGINLLATNQNGSNALHIAVKRGHIEVVKALIQISYPLDICKGNGVSALGIAAFKGHLDIVKALIEAGADVDNLNESSKQVIPIKKRISPLYLAVKGN